MRKWWIGLGILAVILVSGSGVLAGNTFQGFEIVNVIINGKPLQSDVPAVNFFGRTVLPLRAVAEAAGMDVKWDPASKTAYLATAQTSGEFVKLQAANAKLTTELAAAQKDAETAKAELAAVKADLEAAQAKLRNVADAETVIPTSSTDAKPQPTPPALKTAAEIQQHLQANLGSVTTPAGKLDLTFKIIGPNDSNTLPYDYDVWIDWSPSYYFYWSLDKIEHSLTAKPGGREESIKILKAHSKKIYDVMAASLPGKKIEGSFFRTWYRYPTIEVDLQTESHLRWQNFNDGPPDSGKSTYHNATLSQFRFMSDDK